MSQTESGSANAGNPDQGNIPAGTEMAGNAGAAQAPAGEGNFPSLDADMRSFAENKGWIKGQNLDHGAVLKSYRELESRIGNSITLPAQDDAEGWRKVYGKLGMPEKAEGYALDMPEGHNAETAAQARALFHGAGLTQAQAAAVHKGYMEMVSPMIRAQADADAADKAEAAETAKELGNARMEGAKAAFKQFVGGDEALADKLEKTLGSGPMIRLFDRIGQAIGEDGKGALGVGTGTAERKGSGPDGVFTVGDNIAEAFAKTTTGKP